MAKVGKPLRFKSVKELDVVIKDYFDTITKTRFLFDSKIIGYEDEEKKTPIIEQIPILNNAGKQVSKLEYFEIPSITGLCQFIGICKDTWKSYESKEEYVVSIKKAKEQIEKYNVEQLYRRDQVTGIIFNLKNNFGWTDKTEVEQHGTMTFEVKIPEELK